MRLANYPMRWAKYPFGLVAHAFEAEIDPTQYRAGKSNPTLLVLVRFAHALSVPSGKFMSEWPNRIPCGSW
jgi:hypothetical protein